MDDKEPGLDGRIKERLIESKQKWAREGRLLTGETADPAAERLPPGQRLVRNWPVLDLGIKPKIALENWSLAVDGLVARPLSWSWAEFQAQPQVRSTSDIHCVTAWSRYDNRWEGVSARHLLEQVRPLPEARHILFHAHDGYTTNLPLTAFEEEGVLLAAKWEGEPLAPEHGGPVRVVVPKLYFWKSAKWVKRLEFVAEDRKGFWEVRGYHNEADPWKEERYG
jgi:DMSO/TMAO reductase YedYZ molybdopterin-dependent catalytic subunit